MYLGRCCLRQQARSTSPFPTAAAEIKRTAIEHVDHPVRNAQVIPLSRRHVGRIMARGVYFRDASAIASRKAVAAILEPTALRWPTSEAYPSYSAKYP